MKAVPGIDVVIGGHTHTALEEAIIVNGRTPVVQTGKYGENLGELVITLDGDKLQVESYKLHPIDDSIAGDRAIADEIEKLKKTVTEVVFASRGYRDRSTVGGGTSGPAQHVHRHRRGHHSRQPRHRLLSGKPRKRTSDSRPTD